jgi:hypothetical protein
MWSRRLWLRYALPAVFGLLALALVACSGDGVALDAPSGDMSSEESRGEMEAVEPGSVGAAPAPSFANDEGAPPSDSGSGADGDSLPTLQTLGRTIIRSGSIDLEVEEVDTSYHRVQQIATAAGGFVADSTFSGSDEHQRASLTIRVPADRFQSVVDELRGIAVEVTSVSTTAQDVTEEYTDLESSLRNLRAVEAQYLDLLGRANQIGDILQVQERLIGVRDQIERIEGRVRLLDNLSEMATLTVSLRPEGAATMTTAEDDGLRTAVRDAWQSSLDAIEGVATVVVVAVVFSWWLIPVAAIVYFVGRRWLKQRPVVAERVDTPGDAA